MLLTQFGSRWKDPPAPFATITDYDQLDTTVGYNYGTVGAQWSWPVSYPCLCDLVLGISGTVGMTSDNFTENAQDALHDYARFPHVRRGTVDSGTTMLGHDIEAALWRSFYWSRIDLDIFATAAWSAGTHHGESAIGLGAGVSTWILRAQGSYRRGSVDQNIDPSAVAVRLRPSYTMWRALLSLDRTRYPALAGVLPSAGIGITKSAGIFLGEEELLLSLFLEFPGFNSNDSWRIEHVNDVINDKDRGPTGGLRVTYVGR